MVKRTSKQIATDVTTEKYETPTYFKRPRYWARKSRLLWVSIVTIALLWFGLSFFGGGVIGPRLGIVGEKIFMNGPLIDAHASLSQDCRTCHAAPFSHVKDADCLACHSKTIPAQAGAAAHHPWEKREMAACSSCHLEHQGDLQLPDIDNSHCTVCHADLTLDSNVRAVGFTSNPGDHPEIKAVRLAGQGQGDPGGVKFNHKVHLATAEGGVLTGAKEDLQSKKILRCGDCHVPDDHGEYMRPVDYEKHCEVCHAHVIHPLDEENKVPHGTPSGVREYLFHYFFAHPPEAPPETARSQRYVDDEEDFEAGVRAAVDGVERIVHRTGAEGKCGQCHEFVPGSTSAVAGLEPLPEVKNPTIPDRWMEHTRFNHKAHVQIACEECHGDVAQSEKSADVHFALIAVCVKCHSPQGESPANCALCHSFHPEGTIGEQVSASD
jgi:hypothetical protein